MINAHTRVHSWQTSPSLRTTRVAGQRGPLGPVLCSLDISAPRGCIDNFRQPSTVPGQALLLRPNSTSAINILIWDYMWDVRSSNRDAWKKQSGKLSRILPHGTKISRTLIPIFAHWLLQHTVLSIARCCFPNVLAVRKNNGLAFSPIFRTYFQSYLRSTLLELKKISTRYICYGECDNSILWMLFVILYACPSIDDSLSIYEVNAQICRQNLEAIQNDMDSTYETLWEQCETDERDVHFHCTRQVIGNSCSVVLCQLTLVLCIRNNV